MKKFALIIIIAIALLGLVSCSINSGNIKNEYERQKTYTVAVGKSALPFTYEDSDGSIIGLEYDLLKAVGENQQLKFKFICFDDPKKAIDEDKADVLISGMKMLNDNKKIYDYSKPYFQSGVVLFKSTYNKSINNVEDLKVNDANLRGAKAKEEKVAVVLGSDAESVALKYAHMYNFELLYLKNVDEVLESVSKGDAIAGYTEDVFVDYAVANGAGLSIISERENLRSYGIAMKKDKNKALMSMIDAGLDNVMNSKKYDDILVKYNFE